MILIFFIIVTFALKGHGFSRAISQPKIVGFSLRGKLQAPTLQLLLRQLAQIVAG
jgi:hypothetical protein